MVFVYDALMYEEWFACIWYQYFAKIQLNSNLFTLCFGGNAIFLIEISLVHLQINNALNSSFANTVQFYGMAEILSYDIFVFKRVLF